MNFNQGLCKPRAWLKFLQGGWNFPILHGYSRWILIILVNITILTPSIWTIRVLENSVDPDLILHIAEFWLRSALCLSSSSFKAHQKVILKWICPNFSTNTVRSQCFQIFGVKMVNCHLLAIHSYSRWHFDFFFFFFFFVFSEKIKTWHFMWIVCLGRRFIWNTKSYFIGEKKSWIFLFFFFFESHLLWFFWALQGSRETVLTHCLLIVICRRLKVKLWESAFAIKLETNKTRRT